jgi:photosystem II stability/assembly factor-like uncharacterized protein
VNLMTRETRRALAGIALICAAMLVLTMAPPAVGSPAAGGAGPAAGTRSGSRQAIGVDTQPPAGTAPAAAVPDEFKANSITWLSPQRGWVLGAAPCGATTCSDVIGTTDGAQTWALLGTVNSPIAKVWGSEEPGITEIRFATPKVGWAFGPRLFHTTDGGRSWASMPIPGGGKQVLDLAANSSGAYAVVSACKWASGVCSHHPLSFWRTTTLTGSSWTRIRLNLPINVAADVAVHGQTVYVVDSQVDVTGGKDKFYASTDGRHFSARPVPCDKTPDIALIQAVPTSATDVALLCDGNPGFSKADKFVFRSKDTGKTDRYAGTMGQYGIQAELAVSPSGNLAVESWSDGSFMYINDTHRTKWSRVIASGDGGAGWNDIVYVTDEEAWVVYAPDDTFSDLGKLYVTHDGGHHWHLAAL